MFGFRVEGLVAGSQTYLADGVVRLASKKPMQHILIGASIIN